MSDELQVLKQKVLNCKRCPLWKTRNKPVFGEGPETAKIMLIGMGPGREEDKTGRPFVGRAGQLLNQFLELAGIERQEVYITNVVKCFLPKNIVKPEYMKACSPYLDRQIEIIGPRVIVGLGNIPLTYLGEKYGKTLTPITKHHGEEVVIKNLLGEMHIFATFHPAAILRNPRLREIAEGDWKKIGTRVKEILGAS
jgi:uracil-DNA glycosylase family 4